MKMVLFLFLAGIPLFCSGEENLLGSIHARAYETAMADFLGLDPIKDDAELRQAIRDGKLVPIPNNRYVRRDRRLPKKYAYCLPHVRDWLLLKGRSVREATGKPIRVTSAIRPEAYQLRLARRNGNAAPVDGPFASTHPTGATVDIGYKGLKRREVSLLSKLFSEGEHRNEFQATKERYQACFHIMAYPPEDRDTPHGKLAAR